MIIPTVSPFVAMVGAFALDLEHQPVEVLARCETRRELEWLRSLITLRLDETAAGARDSNPTDPGAVAGLTDQRYCKASGRPSLGSLGPGTNPCG